MKYVAALPWELKGLKFVKYYHRYNLNNVFRSIKMKHFMAYGLVDINTVIAVAYMSIMCPHA